MNITIKCPGCGQVLAVPPNLAGRQASCPKCKAPFLIPDAAPAPKPLPMATPLAAPSVPPPTPARSGPPPLPRSAAAQSHTPPAPVEHGGGFDLASLGISSDGTSYVSPSASPGSRSRATKAGGRSSQTTWIVGAICATLLLVAAAVGGWMMLGAKAGVGDDARFLPDDCDLMFTIDVKSLLESGVGRQFKEQLGALSQMPGNPKIKPEDIGRFTFGGRMVSQDFCGVGHFTRPISLDDWWPAKKGTKATVGSYTIHVVEQDKAAVQIDPQTILFGVDREVRKVLARNGRPKMSDGLAAAVSEADFSKSIALALSVENLPKPPGANPMMASTMAQVRGVAMFATVGDDIRLTGALVCKDSTAAENLRKIVDGLKAGASGFNPAFATDSAGGPERKILNSLTVSSSGATVRASVTIDAATINSLMAPIMAARAAAAKAAADAKPSDQQKSDSAKKKKPGRSRQRKPKKQPDPFGQ